MSTDFFLLLGSLRKWRSFFPWSHFHSTQSFLLLTTVHSTESSKKSWSFQRSCYSDKLLIVVKSCIPTS